ncbi:hypothetical protein BS78_K218100 [Paspalum vaginatum]|uniref:Uncharacterized protein n=1 Tax=Paspalum vaginatum TaxID=158149 RepID=A0A9W7XBD3_9POAL|nr:hypothetical protein BS78_K218100 [Paspalum vaginatum]
MPQKVASSWRSSSDVQMCGALQQGNDTTINSCAIAKETKTRDSSGFFFSCEISIQLQESKGKELSFPLLQTSTSSSFPPFSDSFDFPLEFLQSKHSPSVFVLSTTI